MLFGIFNKLQGLTASSLTQVAVFLKRMTALRPADAGSVAPDSTERFEIKYSCDPLDLTLIDSIVRCHPAAFSKTYPTRLVNSIYFDHTGLRNLHDNVAGLAERSKLRARWYGPDATRAQLTIEYKAKQGMIGTKDTFKLSQPVDLTQCDWRTLTKKMLEEAPNHFLPMIRDAEQPIVFVRYERDYFGSANGKLRLTVDRAITAFDQAGSPRPNLRHPVATEPVAVIEFKGAAADRDQLAKACSLFPLRPSAHSKYVTAVEAITADALDGGLEIDVAARAVRAQSPIGVASS